MQDGIDDNFYNRADAVIHLANAQLADIGRGKVSASCMYATARFNSWITATGVNSGAELEAIKDETIDYFVREYRLMLVENLDDYIAKFDEYMTPASKS